MPPRRLALEVSIAGLSERLTEISTARVEQDGEETANLETDEVKLRLADLETTWEACQNIYYDIFGQATSQQREVLPFFVNREFETARRQFREARLTLHRLIPPESNSIASSTRYPGVDNDNGEFQAFSSVGRLNRIDPPTFNGDRAQWLSFRDSFLSMVINTRLSKTDKLNYLKKSLVGNVSSLIKNLPISENNFDRAWREINERYDNPRLLKQAHVTSLLNVKSVCRPNDGTEYERVLNEVQEHLMSLEGLGAAVDAWGELLLVSVTRKFDNSLLDDWEKFVANTTSEPQYEDFKKFDEHALHTCPKFKAQQPASRWETVRKLRVCYNCLRGGHVCSTCPIKQSCYQCGKRHHTLIHLSASGPQKRKNDDVKSNPEACGSDAPPAKRQVAALHASQPSRTCGVLLATAKIRIAASNNRELYVRALIDQGSEASFISQKIARLLQLSRKPVDITVKGIGASEAERVRTSVALVIRGQRAESPALYVEALVLNKLTTHIPRAKVDISQLQYLANLALADDDPTGNEPIELILGAEVFSSILQNGVRTGSAHKPVAQKTTLGWILSGRVGGDQANSESQNVTAMHVTCVENLDRCLRSFWEIEEVPSASFLSPEDERCEELFRLTTIRRSDGRYQIKIPFKSKIPELGNSRQVAFECYRKLEARLNRNPSIATQYHEFLSEYLELGHMSPDTAFNDNPQTRYFLPHHPVIRESSTTTKLRVVFNASARSQNGKSLNDCMFVGPKLHRELFDIILRWRLLKYVCSADIEKMFRQIVVAPEDTAYQCIFWRKQDSESIEIFRLKTVTYGTAAAPYLSMRVLQQLADDEAERFPRASPVLRRDVYVDDVLFGADTVEDCRVIRDELLELLRAGGFLLRKWDSNTENLLTDLPDSLRARDPAKTFEEGSSTKVLGIHWRQRDDRFSFQVNPQNLGRITKRTILSCIASIFDPLGWVSPTVILTKIFLQKLWQKEIDWDSELSQELVQEWLALRSDLNNLSKISLPRWAGTLVAERKWELHGFSDASTRAYAAVVYLKTESIDGSKIILLASKTRVAPVKEMTVPRLELSAAVLLAKLLAYVREVLESGDLPCFCWSDSTIVLAWLSSCPSKWKRFVANRVAQVQESLPGVPWRHVPTESNPADLASRGVSASDLAMSELWWSGPTWLSLPPGNWPVLAVAEPERSLLEQKTQSLTARVEKETDPTELLACRFSSWARLLRFTARIRRCAAQSRKSDSLPSLCQFIQDASIFWIKHGQKTQFPNEIKCLEKGKPVPKGSVQSLDPFLDQRGVLRANGRLRNSGLSFSAQNPIILGSDHLTKLIIQETHRGTLHGGSQLMRRVLREKYWIIRARDSVRSCIRRCVACVRQRATPMSQKMGDLPAERVTPARAFERVGVDYAGPFQVRALPGRGRVARKGYVALFVCLTTRAIHLEFVSDYTSECFLAAFRRFVSRYALPALVMSDNGTTFQGAERGLREAFAELTKDQDLASWFATQGVEWRFIPPVAPHFGGIWEAGVKSTKHHLRRVINTQILTFEEMSTLLAQVSACLNSRSIAPMSDRVDDFSYLTPGHFLTAGMALSVPEPSLHDVQENRLQRWNRLQQMRDQFWRTWRQDYLLQLQQRRKWRTSSETVIVGDIVLLRNDTLPPSKWELGRVIETFPGKDGLVRVVKVKTAKSAFVRAIHKLCLLPLRSTESAEELE